eukprot:TRINITY_DN724_c0_g1_i1.p1 TRINITY_DN724_c0_g1~~TRINITY_DN724_c0_g1_i1.p1  ORF type:complete len:910 (+),score=155.92 TRINITY_DN724_c0_g1_i1:238-2730(+)
MTTCLFYRGCPQNTGFGVYDDSGLDVAGSEYNFGSTLVNLTRMVHQPFANSSGSANYSCWAQAMLPAARTNLLNNKNYTAYQYVTWNNGQLDSFPAENWTNSYGCPSQSFDPRIRPWYVTAMTPPMNIILAISTKDCADGCLALNKQAAIAVLQRCGFWNFIGVIAYDVALQAQLPLMRATSSTVQSAIAFVNSLNASSSSGSSVSAAMKAANSLLTGSSTGGDPVVFWISDGSNNDASTSDPVAAIQQNTLSPHVFSVLIGKTANTTLALPRRFACRTNSVYVTVGGAVTVASAVETVFAAISTGITSDIVRPSEPYVDEASGLNTVSLGLVLNQNGPDDIPIAVGVITIDVTTAYLTNYGAITEDNLVSFLLSTQVFTSITIPSTVITAVTDDTDVCVALPTTSSYTDPTWVTLFGLWVAISVLVVIAGAVIGILGWFIGRGVSSVKGLMPLLLLATVGVVLFGLLAMAIGWSTVWPQYVQASTYKQATMRMVGYSANPYRCCDIENCVCAEATSFPTCTSLLATLTAGTCSNGYYCCTRSCYSCNCRLTCYRRRLLDTGEEVDDMEFADTEESGAATSDADFALHQSQVRALYGAEQLLLPVAPQNISLAQREYVESMTGAPRLSSKRRQVCSTICSTCCICTSSVSKRRCDVACGTCYSPVVTFGYFNQLTAQSYNVSRSSSCSRDNTACVSAYYATWPAIGNTFTAYYSPNNPYDVVLTAEVNMVAFGFTVAFLALTLLALCCIIYIVCIRVCCGERSKRGNSIADVESKKEHPQTPASPSSQEMLTFEKKDQWDSKADPVSVMPQYPAALALPAAQLPPTPQPQ